MTCRLATTFARGFTLKRVDAIAFPFGLARVAPTWQTGSRRLEVK